MTSPLLLRRILFAASLICLAVALFPTGSRENTPNKKRIDFQLGIPTSPLLTYDDVQSRTPLENGGFQTSSQFNVRAHVVSWSAGLLVLGAVLLIVARRLS